MRHLRPHRPDTRRPRDDPGPRHKAGAHLEARLQSLVEGSAARLFLGRPILDELEQRLGEALRSGIQPGEDGAPHAPNLFVLLAHPRQAEVLRSDPSLTDELKRLILQLSQELEAGFESPPAVRVVDDPLLSLGEVRVLAQHSLASLRQTAAVEVDAQDSVETIPERAFLIVDGTQLFPLSQPVINIGRRPDNHLVLDDPRISRLHAQIRSVRGRFVVFDLDSTGGTYVNGKRVNQQPLRPGDVISLAGLPLIYGQEGSQGGETQDFIPEGIHP